ncbi:DUF1963 domain-containing protein [Neobacillus notoginsengisoli]|uniref:DUF1963 domain-containing protein n=2 Tax=Neobacillus notoginsengisoli TaxID=1578198 RepID=A0A417YSD4_9BACI|nr:DUF1963 domain-containing protein [Neobacillus notoginsengisoli]
MIHPALKLPKELEVYRSEIDKTVKPCVRITTEKGETSLTQSKFGGQPYMPKECTHPKDEHNHYMALFAQINFSEVPHIEAMPKTGILQFYLSPVDDMYGLDFDDPYSQKNFRIVFHEKVVEESELITDFSYIPDLGDDYESIVEEGRMKFELIASPVSNGDFRFEELLDADLSKPINHKKYEDLLELYTEELAAEGHRIGGYPYFTQMDPREKGDPEILLFQADTDDEIGLMFGDCGVANFFIREEDLRNRNFQNVLYNWDCC